jgi:hypothetical protein
MFSHRPGLCVGMWCSFVIIHVIVIYKRWQTTRQQCYVASAALPRCVYIGPRGPTLKMSSCFHTVKL